MSWKTTLFGILAAAASGIAGAHISDTITQIAGIASAICVGLLGVFARDNNVTSEQAGAK